MKLDETLGTDAAADGPETPEVTAETGKKLTRHLAFRDFCASHKDLTSEINEAPNDFLDWHEIGCQSQYNLETLRKFCADRNALDEARVFEAREDDWVLSLRWVPVLGKSAAGRPPTTKGLRGALRAIAPGQTQRLNGFALHSVQQAVWRMHSEVPRLAIIGHGKENGVVWVDVANVPEDQDMPMKRTRAVRYPLNDLQPGQHFEVSGLDASGLNSLRSMVSQRNATATDGKRLGVMTRGGGPVRVVCTKVSERVDLIDNGAGRVVVSAIAKTEEPQE